MRLNKKERYGRVEIRSGKELGWAEKMSIIKHAHISQKEEEEEEEGFNEIENRYASNNNMKY